MNYKKMLVILGLCISVLVLSSCSGYYNNEFINDPNCISYEDIRYEDLRFPVNQLKIQGESNVSEFGVFINDTQILYFSSSTTEQVFLTMQLPHARINNTTIFPHFHWSYEEPKATGDVVWCVEYTCANVDDYFPSSQIKCVTDTAVDPYYHHMTDMINIENNLTSSAMCTLRLFRDTSSVNDTFPVDVGLLEFDIHYLNYFYGELDGIFD